MSIPKPRQKKVKGYKMPEPIPQGFVVKDAPRKKEWQIGTSIGKGGFGEIYCGMLSMKILFRKHDAFKAIYVSIFVIQY